MIRRFWHAVMAIAVTALIGLPVSAQPLKDFRAEPEAWPAGTWAGYKARFLMPEGRIVDDANGNISHSEGQGYGMLLAVMANDQPAFQTMWNWTRKVLMVRPDGLAAWKWEPDKTPNVTDMNNASDGDLLIAWALSEAALRWNMPDYGREARRIAETVDRVNGARSPFGRVHMPGAVGFSAESQPDGPVVNLSYWLFPAYEALQRVAPSVDWAGYRASGLTLLRAARFGNDQLTPDWIALGGGKVRPAEGFPPTFSYNAVRIPLYLAWGTANSAEYLRPFVAYWRKNGGIPREMNVQTSVPTDPMGDVGYQAIFALAACALDHENFSQSLRSVSFDRYYSATVHMLALAAARLRYSKCL